MFWIQPFLVIPGYHAFIGLFRLRTLRAEEDAVLRLQDKAKV